MPDQAKPVSRPWRRYLRFSVRGLIVLVLVIGAGLGWIVRNAHIQREAVAAIYSAGGFASPMTGSGATGKSVQKVNVGTRWLVDLIGSRLFQSRHDVRLLSQSTGSAGRRDENLGHLTRLQPWISRIVPWRRRDDAFGGADRTIRLHLFGTQVTDAGLVHLKGLTNLSSGSQTY